MHVVIVPSWYSNEKNFVLGSFFKEQAKALKESGLNITVCYNEIFPIYRYDKLGSIFNNKIINNDEEGLDTYRYQTFNYLLHSSKRFDLFSKGIEKLLNHVIKTKGKIDIIHFHSCFWAGICAPYIKEKFSIPYILTEHTGIENSTKIKKSYMKYILNAYNDAEILISVSNSLKQEILKKINRDIRVIHNFIDGNKFKIISTSSNNKDKFVFFSLAFLVEGKGFENLIKSCKKLVEKGYEFLLEIGGDGYLREKLEGIVKQQNLEKYIKFLGLLTRDEVVYIMNKCDAFILCSLYETFGVVYIEALACGKPVIAVKNGGSEEIINDDVGILVEKNDLDKIFDAMESMICNIEKYDSKLIRDYFIENFEKNIIIGKLKDVYKICLDK